VLSDGDSLQDYGLDATVMHTPGHTAGSCCLVVADSLLFCGDLLSSKGGASKQRHYAQSWQQIDASVNKVKALAPAFSFPGHGAQPLSTQILQTIR
jgi:glyoxylase-like metal-dependent hydrolase (beta-lactamase superfamily II)